VAVSFNGADTVDRLLGDWIGASSWIPFSHQMLADFRAASHWVEDLDAGSPDAVPPLALVSVCPMLANEIFSVDDAAYALNYGCDGVGFGPTVAVGTRLRLRIRLEAADPVGAGVQLRLLYELDADGADQPVCRAHHLFRVMWADS
jgi:hypothetical protein